MTDSNGLSGMVPDLSKVVARFPVCILASLALFGVTNLEIARIITLDDSVASHAVMGLVAMFLAGGVGHLYAEGRAWNGTQNFVFAVGLGGLAAMLFVLLPATAVEPLFLFPGLVLLLMVAGYANAAARPAAFWLFNARLAIAIVVAFAVGLLFAASIMAVLQSYSYLFPPGLDGNWSEHVWTTAVTLVGPVCGLSLIQATLDEGIDPVGDRTLFGRVISIVAAYILVPVMVVAALLIHAYAAKIAWQGRLPEGEIGTIVPVYLLAGTATWLIVQPWAERGNRWLGWFAAIWLRLAIVPVILLAAAVFQRIWSYGLLPERYGLALIGIWMLGLAVYAAYIRGREDGRVAVAGLGIALVVCSFGPWGAVSTSVSSQTARLVQLLETQGKAEAGRLAGPESVDRTMDDKADASVATIIAFLDDAEALDRLAPLFEGRSDNPFVAKGAEGVTRRQIAGLLGVSRGRSFTPKPESQLHFAARRPAVLAAGNGVTIVGPLRAAAGPVDASETGAWINGKAGLVIRHDGAEWHVKEADILEGLPKNATGYGDNVPVMIDLPGDRPAKLIVEALLAYRGDLPDIRTATVWLIVPDGQQ